MELKLSVIFVGPIQDETECQEIIHLNELVEERKDLELRRISLNKTDFIKKKLQKNIRILK